MSAASAVDQLWSLLDTPTIDPARLIPAVEAAAGEAGLDWRTRQLLGESWRALGSKFGPDVLRRYLRSHDPEAMQAIVARVFAGHDPAEVKFPSIPDRLEFGMKPATIKSFLTALGKTLDRPITLTLGGSGALILRGLLHRHTEDLDLADEIPAEVRRAGGVLSELASRFGLRLAHFQTHYLPPGWASRTIDGGSYGKILLRLLDPYDIVAGKVFSARSRDQDDVRVASRLLDKSRLLERVHEYAASVGDDERLRTQAMDTWQIVFLEDLPLPPSTAV